MATNPETEEQEGRSLSVIAFLLIVVVYLAIVQGVAVLTTRGLDVDYGEFPDVETLARGLVVPVALSAVFVWAVVFVLGWRRPVLHDDRPVRRWVWAVPVLMVLTIVAGMNYPGLSDRGAGYTLTFLFGALCVGLAEEGMFRGIGIVTFRSNGFTEGKVALWSCVVFGLAHSTNIFSEGPAALAQVLVTVVAGYFFYLTRRVTKGLLIPIIIHGLWDFALLSGTIDDDPYVGVGLFIFMDVILAIILLVAHRRIEPEAAPAPAG